MATPSGKPEENKVDVEGIKSMDKQIEVLLSCKPLPESEIKALCEKVSVSLISQSGFDHQRVGTTKHSGDKEISNFSQDPNLYIV